MIAAWTALLGAMLTVAACYAIGIRVLAWSRVKVDRMERVPLAFLAGAGMLHLAVFAVMTARIGYKPVWWVLLTGAVVWGFWKTARAETPRTQRSADWIRRILFAAIAAPFAVLYFVNAWAPETSPDGAGYHLGIVAEYLRARGFERIATNFYADLSQGVELLYVPAFAIGKHSAAALVHFAFLIALALAIYAYGRRLGKPWVGAAAAVFVFVSPVVGRDGTTAYIDVATAAIVFAAFYWLEIWDEQRTTRALVMAGAMAGYAFDAKYTMFVMAIYAVAFVAWRSRRWRTVLILAAAMAIMVAPWIAKNWILVHDPVAPFATEIFPSRYFHTLEIEDWAAWLRRYDMPDLRKLPLEVTIDGTWTQGIIGPIFLLVPIGLLALGNRAGRRLLAAGALLLATYFGNIGTRFLIPCLPFFALALALAFERWKLELALMAAAQAVASWPSVIPLYANPNVWRIVEFPYKAALRKQQEGEYLRTHLGGFGVVRMIDENVPAKEPVFSLGGVAEAYSSRQVIEVFPGALNSTLFDILNVARMEEWQACRLLTFHFAEQRTTTLRVVETARGKGLEQWNVHELRFYRRGVEIPRSPSWRIRARPNPWEIQMAFDNSGATRWRSWRTAEPGMFIEVNFGREEAVDEVRMWTSKDYAWPFRFEIQAGGHKVADSFEESETKPRGFLGRAAMHEFAARAVHYILVPDDDRSAPEIAEEPEAWGLEIVARADKTTLYRIRP